MATESAAEPTAVAVSPSDSTSSGSTKLKLCCKCGVDVAGKARMKDSTGKYWCPACGEEDLKKRGKVVGSSAGSTCPLCEKTVNPVDMVRFNGQYVCDSCESREKLRKGMKRGFGGDPKQLLMGGSFVALLVAWVVGHFVFAAF